MCLKVSSRTKKRMKFVNGKATVYKGFKVSGKKLTGLYFPYDYKRRFNVAEGKPNFDYDSYYGPHVEILNGGAFHVCTSLKRMKSHNRYCVVVPVTVYEKDLVAEGEDSEAAFKRIFISKENYDRALKAKTKYELFKN